MTSPTKPMVIALEEHYWDAEVAAHFPDAAAMGGPPPIVERLRDVGALRLKEMDEAGIDVQVLSHGAPATQRFDAETGVRLARAANDRLAEIVRGNPDRFAAFAALPTADPKAAADELERTVTRLGFKGAMIHGLTNGVFSARRRHVVALERAGARLAAARAHLPGALELAAEELREAQRDLSELTGEHTSDDLLGAIFASFCIGK